MTQSYIGFLLPGFIGLVRFKDEHYLLFSSFLSSLSVQRGPGHYTEGERKLTHVQAKAKLASK